MACAACGLWRLGPASCGVRAVGRGRRVIFDLFGWKARFMWRAGCGSRVAAPGVAVSRGEVFIPLQLWHPI